MADRIFIFHYSVSCWVIRVTCWLISMEMDRLMEKFCIHAGPRLALLSFCLNLFMLAVYMCIHVRVSFPKGERLRIPANKCCPECISASQGSCQYEGVVYGVSHSDRGSVCLLLLIIQTFYKTLLCTHKDTASVD